MTGRFLIATLTVELSIEMLWKRRWCQLPVSEEVAPKVGTRSSRVNDMGFFTSGIQADPFKLSSLVLFLFASIKLMPQGEVRVHT